MDLFQSLVTALMIKELELLCFSDIFCICIECLTSWQLGIRVCSGLQHSSFSDLSTPPASSSLSHCSILVQGKEEVYREVHGGMHPCTPPPWRIAITVQFHCIYCIAIMVLRSNFTAFLDVKMRSALMLVDIDKITQF